MGLLKSIREDWAAFLAADAPSGAKAFFSPDAPALSIPIITEQLGTIEQRINNGLTSTGLSVMIATVVAKGGRNQVPGKLSLGNIVAVARCFEQPLVGGIPGISSSDVAEKIFWVTKHFKTAGGSPLSFVSIQLGNDPKRVCYDALFTIDGDTAVQPRRA